MRAVFDPNVLLSSVLSRAGTPAQLVTRWLAGEFELVVSKQLLLETERAMGYPKLRKRVTEGEAVAFINLLRRGGEMVMDPAQRPARSVDPGDDYLIAQAESAAALLVSGDRHLLALAESLPILSPSDFLQLLLQQE